MLFSVAVPIFRYYQNSLIKNTPRMTAHLRGFCGLLGFLSIRRALQEVGSTKIFKCTPGVSVAEIQGWRWQWTDHSHISCPGKQPMAPGNILHLPADTTLKSSWLSQSTAHGRDGERTWVFSHHDFRNKS